ncbi:uncharacterized protein LOC135400067 [Ornithodoros turicata]|uniref:uncharacterized protein LOC135400067 n=1 Tax=Ornithodoros turicata TaxID=34597 RepID=UPI003138FE3D
MKLFALCLAFFALLAVAVGDASWLENDENIVACHRELGKRQELKDLDHSLSESSEDVRHFVCCVARAFVSCLKGRIADTELLEDTVEDLLDEITRDTGTDVTQVCDVYECPI